MQTLRREIARRPRLIIGVFCGAAAVFLVTTLFSFRSTDQSPIPPLEEVYFFDLKRKVIYAVASGTPSPSHAPWQGEDEPPAGMRAYVFSCGRCDQADARFVGWLTMLNEEATRAVKTIEEKGETPALLTQLANGNLVGKPDGSAWYPALSKAATAIRQAVGKDCAKPAMVKPCLP